MTLHGLMWGFVAVALAVGLLRSPVVAWWAAGGPCIGCGHAKSRHRASGCLAFGCDCGLAYGERP